MLLYTTYKILLNKNILAVIVSILILNNTVANNNIGFYNEIYIFKNKDLLSDINIGLIIATVTGDTIILDKGIEKLYKNLQISHLLVLSGSNLIILCHFIFFKNNTSFYIIKNMILYLYLSFVNFLHPLSRAFFFMIFYDIVFYNGFALNFYNKVICLALVSIAGYVYFDLSMSFLLSTLFSFIIIFYDYFFNKLIPWKQKLIFPFYMSAISLPIQIYFFKSWDFKTLLISNLLITPIYDVTVFLMYFAYFVGFIDHINNLLLPYINIFITKFISYIYFINQINGYIIIK